MLSTGNLWSELDPSYGHGNAALHLGEESLKEFWENVAPPVKRHNEISVSVSLLLRAGDIILGGVRGRNNNNNSTGIANDLAHTPAVASNVAIWFDMAVKKRTLQGGGSNELSFDDLNSGLIAALSAATSIEASPSVRSRKPIVGALIVGMRRNRDIIK